MNLKSKIGAGVIAAALSLGLVRHCDRDRITPTEPGKLAPGEKERIEIKGRTLTVIRADTTVKTFVPGGVKVRIGEDGRVSVDAKKFGLCRDFGMGAAWNGDKLKLELDTKFLYYRRLGLHVGTTYDPTASKLRDIARLLAFVSYTVPHDSFTNTSLWLGAELFPKKYATGIRLAF